MVISTITLKWSIILKAFPHTNKQLFICKIIVIIIITMLIIRIILGGKWNFCQVLHIYHRLTSIYSHHMYMLHLLHLIHLCFVCSSCLLDTRCIVMISYLNHLNFAFIHFSCMHYNCANIHTTKYSNSSQIFESSPLYPTTHLLTISPFLFPFQLGRVKWLSLSGLWFVCQQKTYCPIDFGVIYRWAHFGPSLLVVQFIHLKCHAFDAAANVFKTRCNWVSGYE